jgi:post-segregation antitoxin (ccd killing protein)
LKRSRELATRIDGLDRTDKGSSRKYASAEDRDAARRLQKNQATARWRARNKDHVDKQRREYRAANAEICNARTRLWQAENPEKAKDAVYKRKYGITLEYYNQMHSERGGRCDICNQVRKLVVDHCHNSNLFRGLLCDRCNVALGSFEDDPDRLRSAASYIEERSKLVADNLELI